MNKWIYLKSNCPADALALSSVIAKSGVRFNIVRRSYISPFFKGLDNVVVDFYAPADDSELIIIEETDTDSWKQKCEMIASLLGIEIKDGFEPYCGFVKHIDVVERMLDSEHFGLLYLYPHPDQNLDLILIDNLVRLLASQNIKSISGGTRMLPCIKGSIDLREVLDIAVLCAILPHLQLVITTEKSIASICEAFNKNAFVISHAERFTVDDLNMEDATQICNYINLKSKNI